eukprot:3709362-Amphidinium_carterae.1
MDLSGGWRAGGTCLRALQWWNAHSEQSCQPFGEGSNQGGIRWAARQLGRAVHDWGRFGSCFVTSGLVPAAAQV